MKTVNHHTKFQTWICKPKCDYTQLFRNILQTKALLWKLEWKRMQYSGSVLSRESLTCGSGKAVDPVGEGGRETTCAEHGAGS